MFNFFSKNRKLEFDPALGDPLATKILAEVKRGDLTTLLKEIENFRAGHWDERAFYMDLAGQYLSQPEKLNALPDTAVGNLLRGNAAIHLAWQARGGGKADTVSDDGWRGFKGRLDFAGKSLVRAAAQDQQDPTALALLQTVSLGLQLDRSMSQSWFDEAVRRDPLNQQAHFQRLVLLCKKWGGKHEEMFTFAETIVKTTPADSTLQTIIYLAFQEYYLYLRHFDNNPQAAQAFLDYQETRKESIRVWETALMHRKTIAHVADYWPHNLAAFWCFVMGIPKVVTAETQKIGSHFTEFPWSIFYRDPAAGYQKALDFK